MLPISLLNKDPGWKILALNAVYHFLLSFKDVLFTELPELIVTFGCRENKWGERGDDSGIWTNEHPVTSTLS